MNTGKIKTLSEKGFGFIEREKPQKDLFFHSSQLKNSTFEELRVGDTVEYGIEQGEKGPFATGVRVI